MPGNAAGLLLAFVHHHAGHTAAAQFDGCREACGPGADDDDIGAAHCAPIQCCIGVPVVDAATAHTSAEQ